MRICDGISYCLFISTGYYHGSCVHSARKLNSTNFLCFVLQLLFAKEGNRSSCSDTVGQRNWSRDEYFGESLAGEQTEKGRQCVRTTCSDAYFSLNSNDKTPVVVEVVGVEIVVVVVGGGGGLAEG